MAEALYSSIAFTKMGPSALTLAPLFVATAASMQPQARVPDARLRTQTWF
jgi:hypothetical protein